MLVPVRDAFTPGAIGTGARRRDALAIDRPYDCRRRDRDCVVHGATLTISEISPPQVRGKLVSLNQLMITIGIVCSYLADYGLADSRGWRWMFGLAGIPAAILLLGLLFVPESPRWYISRLQPEHARAILARIHGPAVVDRELAEIQTSLHQQEGGWKEL